MPTLSPVRRAAPPVSSAHFRSGNMTTILSTTTTASAAASTGYQPSARRPIADAFRRTGRGAVAFCVRHDVHPDAVSYASVVAAACGAACLIFSHRHPWLLLILPAFLYARLW